MMFNSLNYFLFLPLITGAYFLIPHRFRWALLLTASALFYMAFIPIYIGILAVTIIIDYVAAILMERTEGRVRTWLLIGSIITTCAILFFFKYYLFTTSSLTALSGWLGYPQTFPALQLILPIGLSFHTFQSLSYVIEVYKKRQRAEKHLGIYALYVLFFPQLVAGPVERPQNLLHQFREAHLPDPVRFTRGCKRIIWGLFKKVVIADRLAWSVNAVYADPTAYTGIPLIVATICFAWQIYYDFSGYSDIAIGSADILGFTLMENFNQPYGATSVTQFWQRWHISLSSWLRDYIYIPLGGSRCSRPRKWVNLIITFLVSGLWHGAGWTYLIWGALNVTFIILEDAARSVKQRFNTFIGIGAYPGLQTWIKRGLLFILIGITWVFFRAASLQDAWYILTNLKNIQHSSAFFGHGWLGLGTYQALIAIMGIFIVEYGQARYQSNRRIFANNGVVQWICYAVLLFMILNLGGTNTQSFIYFQF